MTEEAEVTEAVSIAEEIRIARICDLVDPETGPSFTADHPLIPDGPERELVLAYLKAGGEVLATVITLPDLIEPERGDAVPMSFRTDGTWVWTEAVAYYLEEYGLAPDPDLLRHIQSADGPPPEQDDETLERALAALTAPVDDDEPVWYPS